MLAADTGEGLSPAQAACWLDIKRAVTGYLEPVESPAEMEAEAA